MCGPSYDSEHEAPNMADSYTISIRLDMYYSYQCNHKANETEKEFYKRMGWKWAK